MFPIIERGKLSGIKTMRGRDSVAYFLLTFPIAEASVGVQRVKAVDHQRGLCFFTHSSSGQLQLNMLENSFSILISGESGQVHKDGKIQNRNEICYACWIDNTHP
jgi:hypothetical protein